LWEWIFISKQRSHADVSDLRRLDFFGIAALSLFMTSIFRHHRGLRSDLDLPPSNPGIRRDRDHERHSWLHKRRRVARVSDNKGRPQQPGNVSTSEQ